MALIKCPECGKEVEVKNGICPLCGYPLSEEIHTEKKECESQDADVVPVEKSKLDFESNSEEKQNKSKNDGAKYLSTILVVIGIISFILGSTFMYKGFYKKNNYYYSETYSILNENAYVGGDAYNMIINGTYFAGYVALAAGMYVVSAFTMTTGFKMITEKEER